MFFLIIVLIIVLISAMPVFVFGPVVWIVASIFVCKKNQDMKTAGINTRCGPKSVACGIWCTPLTCCLPIDDDNTACCECCECLKMN